MKVKTIDVNVKEWFDRVYGNSYFAGTVTVNYGLKTAQTFNLPFQYGYGEHYTDMAQDLLAEKKIISCNAYKRPLSIYCRENNIILRANKQTGCKKKELMVY